MDRIDSHTPYDDKAVERAFQATIKNEFKTAKELYDIICEQLNSVDGGFVPTSTREMAERLHINDIDELLNVDEYKFMTNLPQFDHDFRVFISAFQDGEGGDYAYQVDVWETDYCGHIAEVKNNHLFDPENWHKGLFKNNKSNERK